MGEKSNYSKGHKLVKEVRGTPSLCEHCGKTTAARFEWASLTYDYMNPDDYVRLCSPCHQLKDKSGWRASPVAAENRAKTHCPHGHEYTEENTYYYNGGRFNNRRSCKICHNANQRRRTARLRELRQNG